MSLLGIINYNTTFPCVSVSIELDGRGTRVRSRLISVVQAHRTRNLDLKISLGSAFVVFLVYREKNAHMLYQI